MIKPKPNLIGAQAQPQFWDEPPNRFKKFKRTPRKKPKKVESLKERQAKLRYKITRTKNRQKKARKKNIVKIVSEGAAALGARGGKATYKKYGKEFFSKIGKLHKKQEEML